MGFAASPAYRATRRLASQLSVSSAGTIAARADDDPRRSPPGRHRHRPDALHRRPPRDERELPGGDRARPRRERWLAEDAADLRPAAPRRRARAGDVPGLG